jgi:DUF2959 family protein
MVGFQKFGYIISLLGGLGILLGGCENGESGPGAKTPPVEKSAASVKLPADLVAFKAEVDKGKAQIDMVIASLESTISAADPKPEFKKYQTAVEGMKAQASTIRSRADAMKSKGKAYFKTWEDQLAAIATPEIKKAMEARRDELAKEYETVTTLMAKAREDYDKFMSFQTDLAKVMENDLNPSGLQAIAPKVAQAKDQARDVKVDVDAVLAEIDKLAAIYSPGK